MDILIEFYKVHYNFGLIAGLLALLALFLLSRRNTQGVILVLVLFVAYNAVVYSKTKHDPQWWVKSMERLEQTNLVDWIWGASTVKKSTTSSEQRGVQ